MTSIPTRTCNKCLTVLPLTAEYFLPRKGVSPRFFGHCRDCSKKKWSEHYAKNAEKYREYHAARRRDTDPRLTKARDRVSNSTARALAVGSSGTFTAEELLKKEDEHGANCCYCGVQLNGKYEIDHVLALCRGGLNIIENIVFSCKSCNRRKAQRTPEEWAVAKPVPWRKPRDRYRPYKPRKARPDDVKSKACDAETVTD